MAENTVYFVTGGGRGIGLGLVQSLLSRPFTTVIASVRNSEAAVRLRGREHILGQNSLLAVLELDFSAALSPANIVRALNDAVPGVRHVDVLINNAACIPPLSSVVDTTLDELRQTFDTNTFAPLMTFQALWPLLQKSATPKVIMMTSSVGSIGGQEPFPGGAYGPSKAAVNWITRAMHLQNESLVAIALHPGWVQTDAGRFSASQWNYEPGPPLPLDESVAGILRVIDGATRGTTSGCFVSHSGDILPW